MSNPLYISEDETRAWAKANGAYWLNVEAFIALHARLPKDLAELMGEFTPADHSEERAREERADANQGLSPDDPRYLDAQFTEEDRAAMYAAEAESERRAEAGPVEVSGGWIDPREDAADRAYQELMEDHGRALTTAPAPAHLKIELTPEQTAALWRHLALTSADNPPAQTALDTIFDTLRPWADKAFGELVTAALEMQRAAAAPRHE